MKTVLVTGGAGYIGSHIAYLLACNGYSVVVLDALVYGQPFDAPWAAFVEGDCGDSLLLAEIFTRWNIDAVIHCAASIEVAESVRDPLAFYKNNVVTTVNLLDSMIRHGVATIIFSSSCAVYGTPQADVLSEEHPLNPISPYGMTKYTIEALLEDLGRAMGLSYVIVRFFNAAGALAEYGLGERHVPETHVIPVLLHAAYEQKPFTLYGDRRPTVDGSCVRDFVHVRDIAHAHLLALAYLEAGKKSEIFNLGTGRGYSVKEIISVVEHVTRSRVPLVVGHDRPGDPHFLVAASGKANDILGWHPACSDIEHIVSSADAFFRQTSLSDTPHR